MITNSHTSCPRVTHIWTKFHKHNTNTWQINIFIMPNRFIHIHIHIHEHLQKIRKPRPMASLSSIRNPHTSSHNINPYTDSPKTSAHTHTRVHTKPKTHTWVHTKITITSGEQCRWELRVVVVALGSLGEKWEKRKTGKEREREKEREPCKIEREIPSSLAAMPMVSSGKRSSISCPWSDPWNFDKRMRKSS